MSYFTTVCILTVLGCNIISAYKLLVFFPYPGKSHTILGEGYVRHLLNAGHEVTYVTAIPIKYADSNLRQIEVSSNPQNCNFVNALDFKKLLRKEVDLTNLELIYKAMHKISSTSLMHENVQKLLLDPKEEFDGVIVEWMFSDLYSGLSTVFNCPFIWSSSLEPHSMVLRLIDEIPNPAYTSDHLSPIESPFTFKQRLEELWNIIHLHYIRWFLINEEQIFKKAFGPAVAKRGRALPTYDEVKYNGSLMLGNSHASSGMSIRLPQNYKPIAGYHIENDVLPLPQDLQTIMDNATNGVIYFSMGTMMKSKTMPDQMKRDFLDMFGGLKHTVIWKYEENLSDLPENVHVVQWAPQQSILAHPNCILFVTHGGLLSTTETLHFGVPIIGIPLFADQFINIKRAVSKGFAKYIQIGYDTPVKLKAAIEDIIENPRYHERVKELSLMYHDRVASPGAELVFWVEHVVRTRGAPHLRSPALLLPWYQKMYLDLAALSFVILFSIVRIIKLFTTKKINKGLKKKAS